MPWRLVMAKILSHRAGSSLAACTLWHTSHKLLAWHTVSTVNARLSGSRFEVTSRPCSHLTAVASGVQPSSSQASNAYSYGQNTEVPEEYRVKQTTPKRYLQNNVSVTGVLVADIVAHPYEDPGLNMRRVFGTSKVEVQDGESTLELEIEVWDDIVEPYQKQLRAGTKVIVYGCLAVGMKDQSLLIRSNRIDVCVPYQQTTPYSQPTQPAQQTTYPSSAPPSSTPTSSSSTSPYSQQQQYSRSPVGTSQPGAYDSTGQQPMRQKPKLTPAEVEANWQLLFSKPEEFIDYRQGKAAGSVKPRHPDFKHRDRRMDIALWVDSKGLPGWVRERVSELQGRVPQPYDL